MLIKPGHSSSPDQNSPILLIIRFYVVASLEQWSDSIRPVFTARHESVPRPTAARSREAATESWIPGFRNDSRCTLINPLSVFACRSVEIRSPFGMLWSSVNAGEIKRSTGPLSMFAQSIGSRQLLSRNAACTERFIRQRQPRQSASQTAHSMRPRCDWMTHSNLPRVEYSRNGKTRNFVLECWNEACTVDGS